MTSAGSIPVLVTGATGFLGGVLAASLHEHGYRVRALARDTSDVRKLAELGVEIVRGDVTDRASLQAAVQGQRFVFHAAAKVSDWAPREEFFQVNTEGTRHVVEACQQNGVERLVHVSSLTVLGLPRSGALVDENTPYPVPAEADDPYTASKTAAEKLVRESHGAKGLATTVVRPGVIWGGGDPTILPRIIGLLRRRRMIYLDGGHNILGLSHVQNLSLGLRLAAETPKAAGALYHVTDGEEITARLATDLLAEAMGVPKPRVSLPFPLAYALAGALELGARAVGRKTPPPITRYGVRLVACSCRYDLSKARNELGYQPQMTFRNGIAEVVAGSTPS